MEPLKFLRLGSKSSKGFKDLEPPGPQEHLKPFELFGAWIVIDLPKRRSITITKLRERVVFVLLKGGRTTITKEIRVFVVLS